MSLKKALFYTLVIMVIVYGQFFMTRGLVTGAPPKIADNTILGTPLSASNIHNSRLIYFWADWCGICTSMQDTLTQVMDEYPGLTIAVKSGDAEELIKYQKDKGFAWTIIADENGKIGERFQIRGVPTLFILDKNGQIRFTSVGYTTEAALRFKLWLASWLF